MRKGIDMEVTINTVRHALCAAYPNEDWMNKTDTGSKDEERFNAMHAGLKAVYNDIQNEGRRQILIEIQRERTRIIGGNNPAVLGLHDTPSVAFVRGMDAAAKTVENR